MDFGDESRLAGRPLHPIVDVFPFNFSAVQLHLDMAFQYIWPVVYCVVTFGIVMEALYKKRVFPFIWRHPDGAIYRDYQPRTYWLVTGFYAAVAILVLFGLFGP